VRRRGALARCATAVRVAARTNSFFETLSLSEAVMKRLPPRNLHASSRTFFALASETPLMAIKFLSGSICTRSIVRMLASQSFLMVALSTPLERRSASSWCPMPATGSYAACSACAPIIGAAAAFVGVARSALFGASQSTRHSTGQDTCAVQGKTCD
jgi:hypothetical protein